MTDVRTALLVDGPARLRENYGCRSGERHLFMSGADHCDCGALRRPAVDVAEACLFTPAYDMPPAEGDIQRRCWTLLMQDGGNRQCELFNGHAGGHQFGDGAALHREDGDVGRG